MKITITAILAAALLAGCANATRTIPIPTIVVEDREIGTILDDTPPLPPRRPPNL